MFPTAVRLKPPAGTYLYVDNIHGSDANDGLTTGTAVATLTHAVLDIIFNTWDLSLGSEPVIVKLLTSSTQYPGIHLAGPFVGGQGHRAVVIEGDTTTPQNTVICDAVDNGSPISTFDNAGVALRGVYLTSAHGACISASEFSRVRVLNNVMFGAAVGAHVFSANEGSVYFENDYSIDAGAQMHFQCVAKARINASGRTVTFTNNANFSLAFAYVHHESHLACGGYSYNANGHTITGKRWEEGSKADLEVDGANRNTVFPGNVNGATTTDA